MVWGVRGCVELEEVGLVVGLDLQDAWSCLLDWLPPGVFLCPASIKASGEASPVECGTCWLFLGWLKLLDVRDLLLEQRQAQEAPALLTCFVRTIVSAGSSGGNDDLESVGEGAEVYELRVVPGLGGVMQCVTNR